MSEPTWDDRSMRALLSEAKRVRPAPADARARVSSRLAQTLAGAAAGAMPRAGREAPSIAPAGGTAFGIKTAAAIVIAALVAGGALALAKRRPRVAVGPTNTIAVIAPGPSVAPSTDRPADPPAALSMDARAAAAATVAPVPEVPAADPPPIVPVGPSARVAARASSSSAARAQGDASATAIAPAQAPSGRLRAERALLDGARAALLRRDAAGTLAATRAHAAQFPAGSLREEREALEIEALALGGASDDARGRAARFRLRYPESLFLPSIDAATAPAP
jgi:hypothetical protein